MSGLTCLRIWRIVFWIREFAWEEWKDEKRKDHYRAQTENSAGPDQKTFVFFVFLTALLLLTVVLSEQICPYDPNAQDTGAALLPPGAGHLAGTDRFGRDMLSRILVGLKTSVTSTLILVVVVTVTGSILGLICGYFGGIADTVIMRVSDICLAFPGLVFAMAIAALLNGGISNAVLALALISWPKYARIARSQTLTVKNTNYMAASSLPDVPRRR